MIYYFIRGEFTRSSTRHECKLEWIERLPDHWGTPWLGADWEVQLGKMLNSEASAGQTQYPYLRNANVQWDEILLDDLSTMNFNESERDQYDLMRDDLLVCEGGEVGRSAIWPGHPADVFYQKALHRLRPLGQGNPRFLMYCLRAAAFMNVFTVQGNESTIPHLTREKLREHRFPRPPLEEQADIVQALDARLARTSGITIRLVRQIELLQERRQALITAAVTGELEIPGVAA